MQTAEELERRLHGTSDLYDIVRTMKSLAAVSIAHHERAVVSINEYYRTVLLGLQGLLKYGGAGVQRLEKSKADRAFGIIVFGSDQGMCGGFNDRIVDFTVRKLREMTVEPGSVRIICVGARAAALLEAEGRQAEIVYPMPGSLDGIVPQSQNILGEINRWRETSQANTIRLFHNRKGKGISYRQEEIHLLPLAEEWYEEITSRPWPSRSIPVSSMERTSLFSSLIRQYLFVILYRAFAESMATENASRLSSMQAAEKNIEERLDTLTFQHRLQRQTSITSELLDIVSGFEALK